MRVGRVWLWAGLLVLSSGSGSVFAQTPENAEVKLARVLPGDAVERVLQRVAEARALGLPAAALEQRALELSAKGVSPDRIVRAIDDCTERLDRAQRALRAGRRNEPTDQEIAAGATALQKGISGGALADLAQVSPPDRSLAVPLLVISSLIDRGLPADAALSRVLARLFAHTTDQQLAGLASPDGQNGNSAPSLMAKDLAASRRPTDLGRPDFAPAGAITAGSRPSTPVRPPGKDKRP